MVRAGALGCATSLLVSCGGSRAPADASPAEFARAAVKLTKIVDLHEPIAMSQRSGDPALYVAEKDGLIKEVKDGKVGSTILDINMQVASRGEQGFLGFDFNPEGDKFYVYFSTNDSKQVVREYKFSGGKGTSPRDLFVMDDRYRNHNGGNVMFGPDGYLYIGTGDGGRQRDPHGNGQNTDSLLGKILRIDPRPSRGKPYTIPRDNPFVRKDGRDEIWAYGLRNPWRWSFDRETKDLWIADVGQNKWEEINLQPADSKGGENYGWDKREGNHRLEGDPPPGHVGPVYEYAHDDENCAVTGGYVYRGRRIPNLYGVYLFGDYCGGRLRGFAFDEGRARGHRFLAELERINSFGEDRSGNVYVLSLRGGVYRIDEAED